MINIWAYEPGDKLRITAIDGAVFEGRVLDITEVGERSDLEKQEDGLGLATADGRHIEFYVSDIKNIELLARARSAEKPRAAI